MSIQLTMCYSLKAIENSCNNTGIESVKTTRVKLICNRFSGVSVP